MTRASLSVSNYKEVIDVDHNVGNVPSFHFSVVLYAIRKSFIESFCCNRKTVPKTDMSDKKVSKTLVMIVVIVIVVLLFLWLLEIPRYSGMDKQDVKHLASVYRQKPRASSDKVVVTLTTIPSRIEYLAPTIASLLDQSVRVDEISLNIPRRSRKGHKYILPKWFEDVGVLKVHRVPKDLGPGTKILPTLKREQKDTIIIAVDDDNIYASTMIQRLVEEFEHYGKQRAISNFGIRMSKPTKTPSDGFRYKFPFKYDRIAKSFSGRREVDFLQGCSGFLVTKRMFPKQVHDMEAGPKEAINVDDMWLSGWLHMNHVPIMQPPMNIRFFPIPYVKSWMNTPSLIAAEEAGGKRNNKVVIDWFKQKGVRLCCDK